MSDCVKYKLATKISHSWLHRYQRHRHILQHRIILYYRLLMIFKIRQITALVAVTVRVWLDRDSVLSSAIYSLLISELLSLISVLSLVSLKLFRAQISFSRSFSV